MAYKSLDDSTRMRRGGGFTKPVSDPGNTLQCGYHDERGRRCRFPGSLSTDTQGGGPWYCSWHFREQHSASAEEVVGISLEEGPTFYDTAEVRRIAMKNLEARRERYGLLPEPGADGPRTREEGLAALRRFKEQFGRVR